jgi:hypothetical protein
MVKYYKKNVIKNLLSTIIIFTFVFFSLEYKLFSFYVPPIKDSFGNIVKFGDWTVIVDLAKCFELGIDVFNNNKCDVSGRPHVYGTILLYLPYISTFYDFYVYIIPQITIFLLIFIVNIFYSPKSFSDYILTFCIIFSTPFILAIERLNIEVIIFFFLILLAASTNSKLQKLIILILSSIKFYPATLGLFFLKKGISFKIFYKNILFLIIILICFFLDKEQILNVFNKRNSINPSTVDNVGMLIFSFYGIPELIKSTILHLQFFGSKKNEISYLLYNISLVAITSYILITFFKELFKNKSMLKSHEFIFNFKYFEDKLFLFSIILILTIYFMSMNYVYKEIYFLGLIPLLKKKIEIKKSLYKKIYNIILIKFILLSFLWIIQTTLLQKSIYFKGFNILIKNLIDLYLISILFKIFLLFLLRSFKINIALFK